MANESEHLVMCLFDIFISSLVKVFKKNLEQIFGIVIIEFWAFFIYVGTSHLSGLYLSNVYSEYVACLCIFIKSEVQFVNFFFLLQTMLGLNDLCLI